MDKNGRTFEVADVSAANRYLPQCPAREAISYLLDRNKPQDIIFWEYPPKAFPILGDTAKSISNKHIEKYRIEACSVDTQQLLRKVSFHSLVFACHTSFCFHYPLTFSPDMIWLLIVQGVAEHVNANANKLRRMFIKHDGKLLIKVERDDLVRGQPNQPWADIVEEFTKRIQEHIGEETSDLFMPSFSTTGNDEKTACRIALMNTVGKYFSFELRTICGIPRITLEGRPEDWWRLLDRVSSFRRFDLDWWIDPLEVVLRQFAIASEGKVNRPFWNSLYRMESRSGGAGYYGWLSIFFPYIREEGERSCQSRLILILATYLRDEGLDSASFNDKEYQFPFPRPGELPQGICSVPFICKYFNQSIDMQFLSGFVGVEQNSNTLALRPVVGWLICESNIISTISESDTGADTLNSIKKENSAQHPLYRIQRVLSAKFRRNKTARE